VNTNPVGSSRSDPSICGKAQNSWVMRMQKLRCAADSIPLQLHQVKKLKFRSFGPKSELSHAMIRSHVQKVTREIDSRALREAVTVGSGGEGSGEGS
jgi:hypothetical protein